MNPVVLVVDDTATNVRLLEAILEPRGYTVVATSSGPEALERARAGGVDLVLLDIQMPDMNGYEVCRRLREDERTAMVPVVMITAAGNEEKVRALEAGADDFVLRPFDQAELLARVRSLVRLKAYHDTIEGQAAELAAWNRTLEAQVGEHVAEIERLRRLRRFLAPHLADMVVSAGDESLLEPHRREVAVLFCDLRGFTAFSSACEPEEALGALQGFHDVLGRLVGDAGATVGWLAGDGVMVFFNDPVPCDRPASRAVALAVALRDEMVPFTEAWRRRGHELGLGAGVAFGFATLGTLGFEGRYDYSAIGPVVNRASRLCDEAASGEILVDSATYAALDDASVAVEPRGDLALRGFPTPTPAWNVAGRVDGFVSVRGSDNRRTDTKPGEEAVEFGILGPLSVRAGGREVEVTAAKERALLALLLSAHGAVVSVERLAEDLWVGDPPDAAMPALRVHVSRLRKTLAASGIDSALVTRPSGYAVDVDPDAVDAARFERLVAAARSLRDKGEPVDAVDRLRSALALWRGPALPEVASAPFAAAEAVRLDEMRLAATEECLDLELVCGRHHDVVAELDALVVAHPLRERLWAQRMVALYRCGRQPEALRAYQDLRRHLGEELGLEPSRDLAALEQAIVSRSPALEWRPAVAS
ncbi:MAG TPA: BTAD domain-containing putative transcriptional regulator [Acidimicrobiales bacterium]|nr:BTAD domain-containing putative transcriptional regulator [Acidimicrobiales bacterium]